jgi:hypothetical protein
VDSTLAVTAEADPVPGNVRVEATNPELHGAVGAELTQPVAVRVTDTTGLALGLVRLAWTTLDGGSVTGSARTDSAGTAQAYWTLGRRAGRQRLLLQVGNPRTIRPAEVLAVAEPGVPSAMVVESGQSQRGAAGARLTKPIVVLVRDSGGNAVAGARLTLAPGAGQVEDSTLTTGPDGRAGVRWSLGPSIGVARLRIGLAGGGAAVQVTATSLPGAPAALSLAARPAERSGGSQRLIATVRDRLGNPVTGAPVRFRASDGRLTEVHAQSDSAGQASAVWHPAGKHHGETRAIASVAGTKLTATHLLTAPR